MFKQYLTIKINSLNFFKALYQFHEKLLAPKGFDSISDSTCQRFLQIKKMT